MDQRVRILLVDDEEPIRRVLVEFIKDIAEAEYCEVLQASDGEEALRVVEEQGVDMVLADVKMPRMSGFQLLERVKSRRPEVVFVILTGYSDTYSRKEALVLGAEDYLTKPFTREEVELVMKGAYWKVVAGRVAG